MQKKEYSVEIGGKTMTAEFNDWADQANGSVLVRYGNSAVLATVVMGRESDKDYFPLSVEYEEKFYAAGAILGSRFMRREGRPSEEAVLSGRIVDRTIRPLFPKGLKRDVQVIISVLSIDEYDTDVLAVNAASLAIATSDIPWNGPVSAVRIGQEVGNDAFIINPNYIQRSETMERMDLLACGKDGLISMIEVGAREVLEATLSEGLKKASEEIEKIQAWQKMIISERGATKATFTPPTATAEIEAAFNELVVPKLEAAVFGSNDGNIGKKNISALESEWIKGALEKMPDASLGMLKSLFEQKIDEYIHEEAIKNGRRADGRAMDEIRPRSDGCGKRGWTFADSTRSGHFLSRCNARPGSAHARRTRRRATRGHHRVSGDEKNVHAPLQLPAVQRRRNGTRGRHEPSHDRPRCACRKSAARRSPSQRYISVHHPHRRRITRIERLDFNGKRMRRYALAHGCRRSDHASGRVASPCWHDVRTEKPTKF